MHGIYITKLVRGETSYILVKQRIKWQVDMEHGITYR